MVAKELEIKLTVPQSMKAEHDELHAELEKAMKASGRVGDAAKGSSQIAPPSFREGGGICLAPARLAGGAVAGKIEPEMADVLAMTERPNDGLRNLPCAVLGMEVPSSDDALCQDRIHR